MKTITKFLIVIALSLLTTGAMAQTTYYVNVANPSPGDGKSWSGAFTDLQAALDVATISGDQIFVAKGTYKPSKVYAPGVTLPDSRYNTFKLNSGVAIYGGYSVDELGNGTRNIVGNETILSGDLGNENDNTDNAYNVVMVANGTTNVVLDGFTITGGNANGTANRSSGGNHPAYYGGGILLRNSYGVFKNLKIIKNNAKTTDNTATYGAGFFIAATGSNLIELDNIEFIENEIATNGTNFAGGGGIYLASTNVKLNRLKFIGNNAKSGGGIYASVANTTAKLGNSIFYNNSAGNGGAIYLANNGGSSSVSINLEIVNNTFYNNTATSNGGAIYLYNHANNTLTINNSVLLGNTATTDGNDIFKGTAATLTVTNSITQGTTGTNVNTTATVADVFLSTTDTDADFLKLKPVTSNPAINGGDENKYDAGVYGNIDLAGTTRGSGAIDMGAYKNQLPLPIKLANFSAKANGNSVVVNWVTETETNNSYFILEKSTDGVNFSIITTAPSKGNGASYSHTDFSPTSDNNYYRLTQVDNDGTKVTYDPLVVNFSLKVGKVSVYPNPAVGGKVTINLAGQKFTSLQLVNTYGQKLQSLSIAPNETEKVITLSAYPSGTYFIVLTNGTEKAVKKVIKP